MDTGYGGRGGTHTVQHITGRNLFNNGNLTFKIQSDNWSFILLICLDNLKRYNRNTLKMLYGFLEFFIETVYFSK